MPRFERKWTDEQDAELRRLAEEGRSMGEAASALKVTRSMVAGRAFRMRPRLRFHAVAQFDRRNHPIKRKARPKVYQPKVPVMKPKPLPPASFCEPTGNYKQLLDLAPDECHWPMGAHEQRPPYAFCAQQKEDNPNIPYCPFHLKTAWRKVGAIEALVGGTLSGDMNNRLLPKNYGSL